MEEEAWEGSSHLLPDHDHVPSLLAHLEGAGDPGWLTRPQGLQKAAGLIMNKPAPNLGVPKIIEMKKKCWVVKMRNFEED